MHALALVCAYLVVRVQIVLDHWLIGEADEIVLSAPSQFGKTAAIRTGAALGICMYCVRAADAFVHTGKSPIALFNYTKFGQCPRVPLLKLEADLF